MGKTQLEKSEAINRQISSNTKCNSKQIVEKANEHPEWLPDGWNVEFRTRKSGAHMGSGYKCYIDPLNGCKFYSKPEVLRYLETIKGNSCTSKKKRCTIMHSPSNVVVEKSAVEDLPPGWIKEVKIRNSSNGIRKDPFYTDPVNGYVFRSKKDALRYLQSGDISTCVFKPTKRQIQDEDKFTPSSAGERQKLKQSATKRQLFVGKEISDESSLELSNANSSKRGQDMKVSSQVMVAHVPTVESVVNMHSLENAAANPPEMKNTTDPDDVEEKNHIVTVMENANERSCSSPTVSKNKGKFNVPQRFSQRLAGVELDQLANNVTNEQTLQVPKRNLRKSKTILDVELANKSSQRLNGVPEIEHSHKRQGEVLKKSTKHSERQAVFREQPHKLEMEKIEDDKPEKSQHSLSRDSSLPSLKVALKTIRAELPSPDNHHNESEIGKSGSQEIRSDSNKSSYKKEHHTPCRASKRLAGFEPELMSNFSGKAPEYRRKKSKGEVNAGLQQSKSGPAMELTDHGPMNRESSNKSGKPPKIPPITNDQLGKHEDEEMTDEKSESQLSFAFHYSWSDPCLDFAINTLTGALPVEDSVGNGAMRIPEIDTSVGSGATRIPEIDLSHKNNLLENVTRCSSDRKPQVNPNKSKNKKELKMPRRLSKRLAGHEPEVLPTERAPEYATRKSCKDKPTATATVILTNGASRHVDTEEEIKLVLHASNSLKAEVCGGSSNKSEKPYDAQTVPNEQLQKLEAENIYNERSEPQFPLPFGNSWSDPCLEFAIKTLTGALPVDAAADILPGMTPDVNDPPNKELHESVMQKSINEEVHENSNQPQDNKDLGTVCQPSKQLLGQPELRTGSTSCEDDPKFATSESYSDEGNVKRNLDGRESLHIEAGKLTQYSTNTNTLIHEEPLKGSEHGLGDDSVSGKQPQLETETVNNDNSESQFSASFMDSWSDPCLEFAFKTLTGAISVEENVAIQGCFQEPAKRHDQRDGSSTLPNFGSSSFSSDISFHNDMGKKSIPGQQSSLSSSFLPLEKSTLHGCTGVDPQKH